MSADTWESTLTEMEEELNRHEEAVRLGKAQPVPVWEPPADLGPLPAEYSDRVMQLVRRIGLLSTFVQFQLVSAENDIKHFATHPEKRSHNRAVALFLDASA